MNVINKVEALLGKFQFTITLIFVLGYFALRVLFGLKLLAVDAGADLTSALMVILSFWFQRTRPRTADDPTSGNGNGAATDPTAAPAAPLASTQSEKQP